MFETLYRGYLTVLFVAVAVLILSAHLRTGTQQTRQVHQVDRYGPAVLGLLVAVALAFGARSGARGGPLVFDAADVRHVLMAPISRRRVILPMGARKLTSWATAGALIGGCAGLLASVRLPGDRLAWMVASATCGLCVGASTGAVAAIAAGRRLPMPVITAFGALLVGWSAWCVVAGSTAAPFGAVGALALLPLTHQWAALALVPLTAGVVVAGLATLSGLSIEAAERRSSLGAQIRFGLATRDLRSVIVVSRSLAQERPRRRPLVRLGPGRRHQLAVWKRDLQGVLRWPYARVLRVAVLGLLTGLAARGVWSGLPALVIPGGVALWLAGVEAADGLAAEVEHRSRSKGFPVREGMLVLRHMAVPVLVLAVACMVGIAGAGLLGWTSLTWQVGLVVLLPAVAAGLGAGIITNLRGPPDPFGLGGAFGPPEFVGMIVLVRESLPPLTAMCAFVPVWQASLLTGHPINPMATAAGWLWIPIVPCLGAVLWALHRGVR